MISRCDILQQDEESYLKERLKKAVLSYPPRWITIGITSACTNKCVFCSYHAKDAKRKSLVYNVPFKLTVKDFEKIVSIAYRGRVPRVHICGTGEPFLNKNVFDMIDCAAEIYGSTSIQTNFSKKVFDTSNYLQEIVKRGAKISYLTTDFLSGDPSEHNELKIGSSYKTVIESLKYISDNSNIRLDIHYILTRLNYKTLPSLVNDLSNMEIKNWCLNIVNLFSYDFNEFTSSSSVYTSRDDEIKLILEKVVDLGKNKGISINIPEPADTGNHECSVFWDKVQTWPVKGINSKRYHENLIPHACRAVVLGNLNSLGYIFDFDNIMDFWNNEKLVSIRKGILLGDYPDNECKYCYCYNGDNSFFINRKNEICSS